MAGTLSGLTGLPFPVAFVVCLPTSTLLLWQFVLNRRAAPQLRPNIQHTVLLDAKATWGRLVQAFGPLAATLMGVVGVAQLVRADGGAAWAGPAAIAGLVLLVVTLLYPITWDVTYKGHRIRFQNYPCLAERLFIDGIVVDRGGIGIVMTLHGTIQGGDGAGDRIMALSYAGFSKFSCRIVAEPAG